jgi:mannose-6-phosphate isomerase-like protein (cupin superfamily)
MRLIDFTAAQATPVTQYESVAVVSQLLAQGHGAARIHALHFAAGSRIGAHPTGFAQLFVVTAGAGWVAGGDEKEVPISAGQAAYFALGEQHAKGSATGMSVIMLQVDELTT